MEISTYLLFQGDLSNGSIVHVQIDGVTHENSIVHEIIHIIHHSIEYLVYENVNAAGKTSNISLDQMNLSLT